MIFIVVKNRVRPEFADQWPSVVAEFTSLTRAEPGNVSFEWSRSLDDPAVYVLVEAFVDADAHEAHKASEHFKTVMGTMRGLLADTPETLRGEIPGTAWARSSAVPGRQ
jgi:quinol monooxygenase YgiN